MIGQSIFGITDHRSHLSVCVFSVRAKRKRVFELFVHVFSLDTTINASDESLFLQNRSLCVAANIVVEIFSHSRVRRSPALSHEHFGERSHTRLSCRLQDNFHRLRETGRKQHADNRLDTGTHSHTFVVRCWLMRVDECFFRLVFYHLCVYHFM